MAKRTSQREENPTKTERIEFRTTRANVARLDAAANDAGLTRAEFLNMELSPIFETARPFVVQMRLFFLQLQHESIALHVESLARELDDTRALVQSRRGTVLAGDVPRLEKRAQVLEADLKKRSSRLAELANEISALHAPPRERARAPTRFPVVAMAPVALAISSGGALALTVAFLVAVAGCLVGIWWVMKRRRRAPKARATAFVRLRAAAHAARDPAAVAADLEMEKEIGRLLDRGTLRNPKEILLTFWTNPHTLLHRLQVMLDRDEGLDALRADLEEGDLHWYNDDGELVDIHVLVATEDQWRLLPPEFQFQVLSKRGQRSIPPAMLRQLTSPPPREEPAPEPATAAPASPPKKRGRPSNAELARRAQEAAPGLLPHQPPVVKGGVTTNGNGAGHDAGVAGGGSS